MTPPSIVADPQNRWYFLPYIEPVSAARYDTDTFMFRAGGLTATAYCLRMVDLHLENVVVDGDLPVIVDPECIFYHFDINGPAQRLRNTGLLSHNVNLSALRGGDVSQLTFFEFDLHDEQDGALGYRKPVAGFRNRIRETANLALADPANHREVFLAGYRVAFGWFVRNADIVCDLINSIVADDFRIRFLVRKTRHYASVIHMLNLPSIDNYGLWSSGVLERFRRSGSFLRQVSEDLISAEIFDLEGRDIPYFWINAGDRTVVHRSGNLQQLEIPMTARERAIEDMRGLAPDQLTPQIDILNEFLDSRIRDSSEH